jgi:polyhydroxyalkanoate synthesis regulator phasin
MPSDSDPSLQAFRDALEKSVTISREKLQEVIDDAVRRGRMTRGDAEEMLGRLLTRGREEAEELQRTAEPLLSGIESRVKDTAKAARDVADEPLARADRLRRRARLPGFPISAYDQLSVPQINNRLRELSKEQLDRVREYELANRNRVGVLRALERKLEQIED